MKRNKGFLKEMRTYKALGVSLKAANAYRGSKKVFPECN